ncbi:MAG TPA: hypothetical protein VK635_02040 [Bradyrhizobium sp.]|jgi:hypothetical protein|nr:hypothetical protein [Bradyrhizobium sp.]
MFEQRPQSTLQVFILVTASKQQNILMPAASVEAIALTAADAGPPPNGKKHKCEKHESDEVFFAKASFVGTRLTAS